MAGTGTLPGVWHVLPDLTDVRSEEFRSGNRSIIEVCNRDFLLLCHPSSGFPSFDDHVIRSHSTPAQYSMVSIDYRDRKHVIHTFAL